MSAAQSAMRAGVHEIIAGMPESGPTIPRSASPVVASLMRDAVALARAVHKSPRLIVLDEPELGLSTARACAN